jgi:hypothetical protein
VNMAEIYAIVPDVHGWRLLPNGNKIKLGHNVEISSSASIGDYASIGVYARIGAYARIGDSASIGDCAIIGVSARIGDYASIGDSASIGDYARIGVYASIGDKVIFEKSPLQIQAPEFLIYPHAPGILGIGCEIHSFGEWESLVEKLCANYGLNESLYRGYADMVRAWMEINMPMVDAKSKEPVK